MGELAFRFRPGLLLQKLKRNSVPERVRGATESRTRQETRGDRSDRCTVLRSLDEKPRSRMVQASPADGHAPGRAQVSCPHRGQ
jgi:hypothetical protein